MKTLEITLKAKDRREFKFIINSEKRGEWFWNTQSPMSCCTFGKSNCVMSRVEAIKEAKDRLRHVIESYHLVNKMIPDNAYDRHISMLVG